IKPLGSDSTTVSAQRGTTARFAVELRNSSQSAVPFGRCPLFIEALEPAGTTEVHQLNCAGRVLAPNSSLTFEMRIHVPDNAPTGSNGLLWELDPTGGRVPEVTGALVVTK